MIVARGLGRPKSGSIVAYGFGISQSAADATVYGTVLPYGLLFITGQFLADSTVGDILLVTTTSFTGSVSASSNVFGTSFVISTQFFAAGPGEGSAIQEGQLLSASADLVEQSPKVTADSTVGPYLILLNNMVDWGYAYSDWQSSQNPITVTTELIPGILGVAPEGPIVIGFQRIPF